MGTLYVNGKKVAEGRIERTQPMIFSADETADVGIDRRRHRSSRGHRHGGATAAAGSLQEGLRRLPRVEGLYGQVAGQVLLDPFRIRILCQMACVGVRSGSACAA
jgi:hypothetical protein